MKSYENKTELREPVKKLMPLLLKAEFERSVFFNQHTTYFFREIKYFSGNQLFFGESSIFRRINYFSGNQVFSGNQLFFEELTTVFLKNQLFFRESTYFINP